MVGKSQRRNSLVSSNSSLGVIFKERVFNVRFGTVFTKQIVERFNTQRLYCSVLV
jgi:hypothetical protein